MTQSVQEQIRVLPAVEPELHLFEVGRKVLCAQMMPSPHHSPLEKREGILDGVGVHIADHINFRAVIDGLVLVLVDSSLNHRLGITSPIIGHDLIHIDADAILEVLGESFRILVLNVKEPEFAPALPNANYDFFVASKGSLSATFDAANVGFVHLHGAIEHFLARFDHCGANPMTEIPRRLIAADSNRALDLAGRYSLFCFAEKQGGEKPFRQRQMRIIEDRSCCRAEHIHTDGAPHKVFLGVELVDFFALAARADRAFRPAQPLEETAALFIRGEIGCYIN